MKTMHVKARFEVHDDCSLVEALTRFTITLRGNVSSIPVLGFSVVRTGDSPLTYLDIGFGDVNADILGPAP